MSAMRPSQVLRAAIDAQRICCELEIPALRFRDKKISENLHARDRFQLFRIDEIGIQRDRVVLREQLHEALFFFDQVVR